MTDTEDVRNGKILRDYIALTGKRTKEVAEVFNVSEINVRYYIKIATGKTPDDLRKEYTDKLKNVLERGEVLMY